MVRRLVCVRPSLLYPDRLDTPAVGGHAGHRRDRLGVILGRQVEGLVRGLMVS